MRSIPQFRIIDKAARAQKTANAVIVNGGAYCLKKCSTENLRGSIHDGSIKGLSANSLSRLRDAIARTTHASGACRVYGLCLTIPWRYNSETFGDELQAVGDGLWREWVHHLDRLLAFFRMGGIYRVELQVRKMVHWHAILYLPCDITEDYTREYFFKMLRKSDIRGLTIFPDRKEDKPPAINVGSDDDLSRAHYWALSALRLSWMNAITKYHCSLFKEKAPPATPLHAEPCGGVPARAVPSDIKTLDFCYNIIPLDGVKSGIAYLASHTTKHKQEQLGYKGKQWGYLGRKWLSQPSAVDLSGESSHNPRAFVLALRMLRKWIRRNRFITDWRVARPRVVRSHGEIVAFRGLVVRNPGRSYLFGTPSEVVQHCFRAALDCVKSDVV